MTEMTAAPVVLTAEMAAEMFKALHLFLPHGLEFSDDDGLNSKLAGDGFNALNCIASGAVVCKVADGWPDVEGRAWSAGRREFEKHARAYQSADGYEIASSIADRAPELIVEAMRAATK